MRTLLALTAIGVVAGEESTLRRAAEEARKPDERKAHAATPSTSSTSSTASQRDDDDGDCFSGLFNILGAFNWAMGSGDAHWRGSYAVPPRPYVADYGGWLVWQEPSQYDDATRVESLHEDAATTPTRWWALRLGVDAARIEDDLGRGGVDLRGYLPLRFELAGRGEWYRERVDGENVDLQMWGADLAWRALQFANCALRIGGGVRWLHDDYGDESGAVALIGVDIFPIRPVFVAGSYAAGALGSADLTEARAEVGALIGPAEAAIGYELTRIGAVDLEGPYITLRWWF